MISKIIKSFLLLISLIYQLQAQVAPLITNINGREIQSLNGPWKIIIDPYENGFYDYRYNERSDGFFLDKSSSAPELIEYDFDKSETLYVPGDWNSQKEKLELYEGTIWYRKKFDAVKKEGKRYFIWIGAANYISHIYLNGKKLGMHEGGFTPFNFEVTTLLKDKSNSLVIKVDNKRKRDGVPTLNTDWWNYGGITRDVDLVEVPDSFIEDYFVQLKKGSMKDVEGWVKLNGNNVGDTIKVRIPELKFEKEFVVDDKGIARITFTKDLSLWSPSNPKLYKVVITSSKDAITDEIGFRSIETKGQEILLNGKPVFLKGVCIHEEAPFRTRRANGKEDAMVLLGWAKEMGCNYVRLAHYPHNDAMLREADKMGLMVWSEIPVYWTIQYENDIVLANAKSQLADMITRDKNRASIIIWSMANETPVKESRNKFISSLASRARSLDSTRLISAALEIHHEDGNTMLLDDPLGEYLDVLGCNEYIGWYGGTIESCSLKVWKTTYNKPLLISEFGAAAQAGLHGLKEERWTEQNQEYFYQSQLNMLKNISFLRGMSPWVLVDFKSPRRQLPGIQDMYNRKGLISDKGQKKKAFFVMKRFYQNR